MQKEAGAEAREVRIETIMERSRGKGRSRKREKSNWKVGER
jgi:hypothetical protein